MIPEEEELEGDGADDEGAEDASEKQEGVVPVSLAPATSEEALDGHGAGSYCYGTQVSTRTLPPAVCLSAVCRLPSAV